MALIRLYMTMSLDGYVTGPQDSVDAPMGIEGFRLFNWLDRRNDRGPSGQVAGAAQALLRAGQLDELELHVVPGLLGQGRRLFDNLPAEHRGHSHHARRRARLGPYAGRHPQVQPDPR